MGLSRLSFLLSLSFVFAVAACGDNLHGKPDDAGSDGSGSNQHDDGGIDAPPDALTCTSPQIKCGGACVNPTTDNNNCGACGTTCGTGAQCQTDGSSTICCPAGQHNCGGVCVDFTDDENHCGSCTTVCTNTQTCDNGTCCGAGTTTCSTSSGPQCFDLNTDEGHCGSCTTTCTSGQTCTTQSNNTNPLCCATGDNNCSGTCSDPLTDNNNCGACGNACGSGQSCSNGVCCGTGQTNCGGTCVDLKSDEAHCGTCSTTCSANQTCTTQTPSNTNPLCCANGDNNCGGTCSDPLTDNNNCGACGNACGSGLTCSAGLCCGPGETNCGGTCVDLIDDAGHCGTCGTTCSGATPFCGGGQCSADCGPGENKCGNNCVNFDSDHDHCGDCATACGPTQVCNNGTCSTTCAAGEMSCGGSCVNVTDDPNHCGNCGTICSPTDECVNGICQLDCPAGEMLCGGVCRNLLQDNAHCGSCTNACGTGQTCDLGLCCPAGQTNCNGTCKDLTASTSCGTCTNTCGSGTSCSTDGSNSTCCPTGQINCNGTCVDPKSDEANCGGCAGGTGTACAQGATCDNSICCGPGTVNTGGICCPIGDINCNSACFNPQTSNANCGTCGNACGGGQVCNNGACDVNCTQTNSCGVCHDPLTDEAACGASCAVCPTGTNCVGGSCTACPSGTPNICNAACTNTQSDPLNCGACNTTCGVGQACVSGTCCTSGQSACGGTCFDPDVGIPQGNGTTLDCGGCGPSFTCAVGSVCNGGTCSCGFGQQSCNGSCKVVVNDPQNCGACGNVCGQGANAGKPLCVSGGCTATCPAPLVNCGGKCVNRDDDDLNCGQCGTTCNGANKGCSAGSCVNVLGPFSTPTKCNGGGPPIIVPTGGGDECTGNLGAVAFTFGLCSRTKIGALSRQLYTDAFDSTSGPYVASCTTADSCAPKRCTETKVLCTSNSNCTGSATDICENPVKCVGGTCVGGGVGVNGTSTPVASDTANTHVGGDFWVFGVTGLAMKGDTQVKQRFFNQGTIDVGKTSHVYGPAFVNGAWTSGGNADMTIDGPLKTAAATCPPLAPGTLHLNGGCTAQTAFPTLPPPCGTDADLIDVHKIVDYYALSTHNDNAAIGLSQTILDAPTATVRLDLPCGVYYFNQMNIGKDTTIVVHGHTALVVGGAIRVSQKLILDLDATSTLDIFVGGVMNVSNIVELGSPAFPARSRLYFGNSSCAGTGTCTHNWDCCSGVCNIPNGQTSGTCGGGGGGNLSQSISLSNGGFFNGLLWGGYGQFTHSNPLEMYGSIFANYFDASGDTIVHYDIGATKLTDECPQPPPGGGGGPGGPATCESCRDCGNQACVAGKCGACTDDNQCCPPLHCDVAAGGVCKL